MNTVDRFSLIFRSKSVVSSIDNLKGELSTMIYSNEHSQIIVNFVNCLIDNAKVDVYNAVGQKLVSQRLTCPVNVISKLLPKGVYLVNVSNDAKSLTQKIILK